MFTLSHPRLLPDIIRLAISVHGPSPIVVLDFPHDSVAWQWLRRDWQDVHADSSLQLHLMLMGTDYAQNGCAGLKVPLGIYGADTPICFSERDRLDGLEYLRDQDSRFEGVDPREAYAFILDADTDGSWKLANDPLTAICQLTISSGLGWRSNSVEELAAFREFAVKGSPTLDEAALKANAPPGQTYADYAKSVLRLLALLRRVIGS